jgi:AcrR family transcriptional regulator
MSTSGFGRSRRGRANRGPIWSERAPGERRPKFTREQIAKVAIEIADREGFDAVSMRRVADELGAGTMTLYHYVRTKQDLMALMDDEIAASILVPQHEMPTEWRPALHRIALASYRVFMRHPWALNALRGVRFGPNSMRHVEQSMAAVANAPFDLQGKLDALGIVDDYVFGYVTRAAEAGMQEGFHADGRPSRAMIKFADEMIATGEFPHLARLLGNESSAVAWDRIARFMNDPARFLRGLDVLLDGLEARSHHRIGTLRTK